MASSVTLLIFLLLVSSIPLLVTSATCNKEDKQGLLAISNALGPFASWKDIFGGCCSWEGVTCDANGRVSEVDVSGGDTPVATIPSAIASLEYLQVLRFHKLSNLTGVIVPEISKLVHLRFLTISWTSVYGPVPDFLSKLQALEQLDLSFNKLSGTIPASLGDLPRLYAIDLSRNQLTGSIPSTLFRILGPSPTNDVGDASLTLSHNNLTGDVPPEFSKVKLSNFDVSRNQLTGDVAFLFGESKSLEFLDISRNKFAFDLSNVAFPLVDLVSVTMDHNMIYGSIPKQITKVTNFNFNFFNVSYNRLCGEIPTGGPMKQFDSSCYIHNRCLCGTPLPPC